MLADEGEPGVQSGSLRPGIHLPSGQLLGLIDFIAEELPRWRDRPERPPASAETILTHQLCSHLNGVSRQGNWDWIQFRTEVPDEKNKNRRYDLSPAPSGRVVWIGEEKYNEFDALLPIECKRLPVPPSDKRDKREYLFSERSSMGGIQRFKDGHHGSSHKLGAMIAYVQECDILTWSECIASWIRDLVRTGVGGWALTDLLVSERHDVGRRIAVFSSNHARGGDLPDISLRHLWVEMTEAAARQRVTS